MEASSTESSAYQELQAYTVSLRDPEFIHQYVVDAWAAQHADEATKPIALTFALLGLELHLEQGFSGREVQRVHVLLGRRKHDWPPFALPAERGAVTAIQVMAAPAGAERKRAIDAWCASVWAAYHETHQAVADLLAAHGIGPSERSVGSDRRRGSERP